MKNITNDKVTEYICRYYHPVNEDLAHLREIGERDNVPIILKETEMILTTLLNLKRPAKILEIGTAIGYSSIYFATVCPDAEVYTIEKNEQMLQAARHNIAESGLENRIHSLFGDGQEQIEKLASQGITGFDFVFIDAAKSHYRRFFDAAVSVSVPGA
ncbi:MAG: class I SAM-dependent methyltransferase, partial [Firmicutes bacterium]|nr:class I SAM-dependent methyltransferase [Bacillota bacterium]